MHSESASDHVHLQAITFASLNLLLNQKAVLCLVDLQRTISRCIAHSDSLSACLTVRQHNLGAGDPEVVWLV